jgi:hypothetical protein
MQAHAALRILTFALTLAVARADVAPYACMSKFHARTVHLCVIHLSRAAADALLDSCWTIGANLSACDPRLCTTKETAFTQCNKNPNASVTCGAIAVTSGYRILAEIPLCDRCRMWRHVPLSLPGRTMLHLSNSLNIMREPYGSESDGSSGSDWFFCALGFDARCENVRNVSDCPPTLCTVHNGRCTSRMHPGVKIS